MLSRLINSDQITEKQKQDHCPKEIVEQSEVGEAIKLFLRYELVRNSSVNPFLCFFYKPESVSIGEVKQGSENIANKKH